MTSLMIFGLAAGGFAQDENAAKKAEKKAAKKLNNKIEKSIAAGLNWLAAQQHPNGSWDFARLVDKQSGPGEMIGPSNAATGIAMLRQSRTNTPYW